MDELEILRLKSQGLCCSQIMVKLVLDLMDRDNPDLVAFSRGLCLGYGEETGACGILTAGICIMAMYAPADPDLRGLLQESFVTDFKTWTGDKTSCRGIVGDHYPNMHPSTCGSLLVKAHERLVKILAENGIDPADPEIP